jgi:uncharacterized protein YkwD
MADCGGGVGMGWFLHVWAVARRCFGRTYAHVLYLLLPLLSLVTTGAAQSGHSFSNADEQETARLINKEREQRGLPTLVFDEKLQQAARKHCETMAAQGKVTHQAVGEANLSLRLQDAGLRFGVAAENVASAAEIIEAQNIFMESPLHRDNILNRQANAIGVGVVRTPGGMFVTEDFVQQYEVPKLEDAEERVAAELNRLRSEANAPVLIRIPDPKLRKDACEMASSGKLSVRSTISAHNVRTAVAFMSLDLGQIAHSLEPLQSIKSSGFSTGVCFQPTTTYKSGAFWVLVATYF